MQDTGNDTLQDQICVAFNNRALELECDISSAAYVVDQQFVRQSRNATPEVTRAFFSVARNVLNIQDDTAWRTTRQQLVSELAAFRMKQGGFAREDYTMSDTCAFWGTAGCYAPTLRKLAFALTSLPCSSGEAERNWQEVKQNLVKNRNRLGRKKLEKMVFVRRFIRLKRKLLLHDVLDGGFSDWVECLLKIIPRDLPFKGRCSMPFFLFSFKSVDFSKSVRTSSRLKSLTVKRSFFIKLFRNYILLFDMHPRMSKRKTAEVFCYVVRETEDRIE
jgi:hypothetical protein